MKNFYQKIYTQYLKPSFFRQGFTFLETIIVIAIIGIILAITLPQFSNMKKYQVLKSAGGDIVSSINKAQTLTRASKDSANYGVHFQADKIIIFKGTVFFSDDANNQNIDIVSPATISGYSFTGGGDDIYFNRLTGLPNKTGTATISIIGNASMTKTITIGATGIASIN